MTPLSQNRFSQVASSILSRGQSSQLQLEALTVILQITEATDAQAPLDSSHTACGPGCGSCCAINISILEPEALAIAGYVNRTFSSQQRARLIHELGELHQQTRWLDDEERMMTRKPCAFLDDQQNCSIHPVRPLMCRSLSSIDPGQCRDAIALLALGEPPRVICNLQQKQLYNAAYLGLAMALDEQGYDDRSHRLAGRLYEHLDNKKGHPYLGGR